MQRDEALSDETPAWRRGLLVLFRDPENPTCALPNSPCAGAAADGDDETKDAPTEPVTRAVVLLHHLGRFSILHTYLAHVSFKDGKGTTTQSGEHTIHRISRTMAGEDIADFLFMLAGTMETSSGMEERDGEDQLMENWLRSWIDLDTRKLREVTDSELAQLSAAGEAVAERCGKTRVNGRSPDDPGEVPDGNEGPGCRSRDSENPCSMDEDLRNED